LKNKFCDSLLIFVSLLILLPQVADAKKIALNPSNQTTNPVCGGGNEAQYAELSADQAYNRVTSLGHTAKIFLGFDGVPAQVNTWGADAFVSMHTNALNGGCSSDAHGLIVFYNYNHSAADVDLAHAVDDGLVGQLSGQMSCGWYNRGYRDWYGSNLYVLSGVTAPCCLEESLFHDCTVESAFLRTSNGQTRIGIGVANGALAYLGEEQPDLTIFGSPEVSPTSVSQTGTIQVDWTEKNIGSLASTPAHHTRIFLSTTAYGTTYQLAYCGPMNTLAVGATHSYSEPALVVPASVPVGDYYVTVFIDCDEQVAEANEGNNIGSTSPDKVTVTLPCGGRDYPAGDISGPQDEPDCYVDLYDLMTIAADWLSCNDPKNPIDCPAN